jgi:hypothetical protein
VAIWPATPLILQLSLARGGGRSSGADREPATITRPIACAPPFSIHAEPVVGGLGYHRAVLTRLISGGQTGADRAALDAAIELGIEHGGWCPRGRRAEDGPIDLRYQLRETDSDDYRVRTERNVIAGDLTVLITEGKPTGGSALTAELARHHGKPLLWIDLSTTTVSDGAAKLRVAIDGGGVEVLNVAGPRESTAPGIGELVKRLLRGALSC